MTRGPSGSICDISPAVPALGDVTTSAFSWFWELMAVEETGGDLCVCVCVCVFPGDFPVRRLGGGPDTALSGFS